MASKRILICAVLLHWTCCACSLKVTPDDETMNIVTTDLTTGARQQLEPVPEQVPQMDASQRLLLIIPGFSGDEVRFNNIRTNIEALKAGPLNGNFDCVLYLWKEFDFDYGPIAPCRVAREFLNDERLQAFVRLAGDAGMKKPHYWAFFMKSVAHHEVSSHTHIAVVMDDVDFTGVHVPEMLSTMDNLGITVASPGALGSPHKIMQPRKSCNGTGQAQEVDFVEILFTVFKPAAFECWQGMLDLDKNPLGWGYDLLLKSVCNPTIAIFDRYLAIHPHGTFFYNSGLAKKQMEQYLAEMAKKGYASAQRKRGACLGA